MTKRSTHMRLDEELLKEVDKIGQKLRPKENRTQFVEKAVWDRIKKEKYKALDRLEGK